ncbi:hypothetical protein [Mesorhizobium sp. KR2-14]|jgi:hypothetical protein|uniref:hypothetical protein n=1 Tax=Mesorhizobium sp. KR2-14 TaxID=3156610 RepID=UPI0032B3130E
MALEELKAQIGYLVGQMVDRPEDAHEIYERIREKLNELRAMGMPLPADLVELEKQLDANFGTANG